jgi:hypothetical protein
MNIAVTRNSVTSCCTDSPPPAAIAALATAIAASSEYVSSPARRINRSSTRTTAKNFSCTSADSCASRRTANACPRLVRRSLRAATASSKAAAWSVHAISSTTLRRAISPSIRRVANHTTTASSGNKIHAGHHVSPATIHIGTVPTTVRPAPQSWRRTSVPTAWVSSSTRSRTSPTACSESADSGCRSAAFSRSLRSLPSARSTTPAQIT